jgi:hypothetical protein
MDVDDAVEGDDTMTVEVLLLVVAAAPPPRRLMVAGNNEGDFTLE